MSAISRLYNFVNGQNSDADAVDAEFDQIIAHINAQLVHKDGSVAMTGALQLPSNPTANLHAATKQYVDGLITAPAIPGAVILWPSSVVPGGWLHCDGSAISRVTYAALFAVMGTQWGAGDGATTFNLPETRGRFPIGAGAVAGMTTRVVGERFGSEHLQEHVHAQYVTANPGSGPYNGRQDFDFDGAGFSRYLHGTDTAPAGVGQAENIPPAACFLVIVKT